MILNGADDGKHTGITLIDLQKAFDTLDHAILLEKMKCICFSNKTTRWFHSYLTERVFFVSFDNELSEAGTIKCRVPHGSILGPSLFLLYTYICKCYSTSPFRQSHIPVSGQH